MTLQLILWIFCLHYVSPFILQFKRNINNRNVSDVQLNERTAQDHIISFSNKAKEQSLLENVLEEFMTTTVNPRSICPTMKILKDNHASVPHSSDCTNGFQLGSTCLFHCNKFFEPENSDRDRFSTCMEDGSWVPSIPKCIPIRACPTPDFPAGLHLLYDCSKSTGSTCRVQCTEGLILYGSSKLVCQNTGLWTKIPSCGCPIPNLSDIIDVENECFPYIGETCDVRCKKGFVIDGPSYIRCQNNGLWSSTPKCIRTCNSPKLRDGLSFIGKCVPKVGNMCQLFCEENILDGPNKITCLEDGSWSKMPYCIKKTTCCGNNNSVAKKISNFCPDPVSPNLNLQNCSKKINSSCIVACKYDNILIGPSLITCLSNTTWSEMPYCIENSLLKKSIVPSDNTNKTTNVIEKTANDVQKKEEEEITISSRQRLEKCAHSKIPDHIIFKSRTCQKSKLICEVGCKVPFYQPNREISFIIVSVQKAHCDKNGLWNNFPHCLTEKYKYWDIKILEYLCPKLNVPNNMKLQSNCLRLPKSECFVSCINGTILYGSNIITCSNKKWSPLPACMFPPSEFKSTFPQSSRTKEFESTRDTSLPASKIYALNTFAFKEKNVLDQIDQDIKSIVKTVSKNRPFGTSAHNRNLPSVSVENSPILTAENSPVLIAENSPILIAQNVPKVTGKKSLTESNINNKRDSDYITVFTDNKIKSSNFNISPKAKTFLDTSIDAGTNSEKLIYKEFGVNEINRFEKCKQVKLPDDIIFIPSNCPNSKIKCNVSCITWEKQKRILLIQEIFCDEFGEWKNVPNCSSLIHTKPEEFDNSCPIPDLPNTLKISKDCSYSNNDECTVFCKSGMILQGPNKIICKQGVWSIFPVCISEYSTKLEQQLSTSCQETKVPENIIFIPANCKIIANTQCKVGCSFIDDKGSKVLTSVRSVICNKNKMWEGLPNCTLAELNYIKFSKFDKKCTPLTLPSYLQADANCDPFSVCTVSCKKNMMLYGSKEIICQDGSWSTLPTCKSLASKTDESKYNSIRSKKEFNMIQIL